MAGAQRVTWQDVLRLPPGRSSPEAQGQPHWRLSKPTTRARLGSAALAVLVAVGAASSSTPAYARESAGSTPSPAASPNDRSSTDVIARAALVLKHSHLYVDPPASSTLTATEMSGITGRLVAARTPIYVAVLAKAALRTTNGNATLLAAEIHEAAGSPQGTFAVLAGGTFAAGSTVLGKQAGYIAADVARRFTKPADRLIAFADELEAAALPAPTGRADEPGSDQRGSGGLPIGLALLPLGLLTVGWIVYARRRRRDEQVNDLRMVRRAIDDDLTSYGIALRGLDSRLRVPLVDPPTRRDYGRALEAYERARQAAGRIEHSSDAEPLTAALERGWYAMASAQARLSGNPVPAHRPPCLFNPQHGPAATDVLWNPTGGSPRRVPSCTADARRIGNGSSPAARTLRYADGMRPYWETGPAYASWAAGWYVSHGPRLLVTLLYGTPLGGVLDDPAAATAESPFDGWAADPADA
jgi:hypothetical protein